MEGWCEEIKQVWREREGKDGSQFDKRNETAAEGVGSGAVGGCAALLAVGVIHHANTAGGRQPGAALCRAGRE